ncbi:MAG: hypothetical protein QG635_854 [Bacteroidota bacterium]|nr:hypothetical protein [Bacteroidota bacterium]
MINLKQKQLIEDMLKKAKEKYADIELKNISFSPDDSEHIFVNIRHSMDEDELLDFYDFAAELDIETLMDYGYKITLMPTNDAFAFN